MEEISQNDDRFQLPIEAKEMCEKMADQNRSRETIIEVKTNDCCDPMCDSRNPRVIKFKAVTDAADKIRSGIVGTPCSQSEISSTVDIYFKKDFNQRTGSFKERGARYALLKLSENQRATGVISASAGNHAQALACHGKELEIPVTVVMPRNAPIVKVKACRKYKANVILHGIDMAEAKEFALRMAKEKQLIYINGYDHPDILAGQGTMGLEILAQVPDIDAIVVPIGGGGLIAGVALAIKSMTPNIQVIGVEADVCASFSASLKAGKPTYVKAASSLADGLIVPVVGVNAFATASQYVDKVVTVSEDWIATAILQLLEVERCVVEGAGAVSLAAILAGKLPELNGKRVVVPLTGGNIDTAILKRCIERGMAADGRIAKFAVTLHDMTGGIAELTRILSEVGVIIRDLSIQKAWTKRSIFQFEMKFICETRDFEHFLELKSVLESFYNQIKFKKPVKLTASFENEDLA